MATTTLPNRSALVARQSVLVQRLDDGDRRIDDARLRGASTEQWETFWLQLLEEYVAVSQILGDEDEGLDVAA